MIILDYKKYNHKQIIHAVVLALKKGKVVAYPTDTSYGLAVDATNISAIRKLYRIKGRSFNKPVHVVVPSVSYGRRIVVWSPAASKLARKFWPGALSLVLRIKNKVLSEGGLKRLTAKTGFLGVRIPDNQIANDLARALKRPITATSANRSGQKDCYSADEIISQFKSVKYKPEIIIDAGKLPRLNPSTVVKIDGREVKILRIGPISEQKIKKIIKSINI